MGAGKSRRSEILRSIIEFYNEDTETLLNLDIDTELNRDQAKKYIEGILDFKIIPQDFRDFLEERGIQTIYDWDLNVFELDDRGNAIVNITDPDLQYHIMNSVNTADIIQTKFQQITGTDENLNDPPKMVHRSTIYPPKYINNRYIL